MRPRRRLGWFWILAVAVGWLGAGLLCGCGHAGAASSRSPSGAERDRAAEAAAAARTADLAFSSACMARDLATFTDFIEQDAVFVNGDGAVAGRAAVGSNWAPFFGEAGPQLGWAPDQAEAASSGDVVFTRGDWVLRPAGAGFPRSGRYLTVWRKASDGRWRVALDGPDAPLPAESDRAARVALKRVMSADATLAAVAGLLMDGPREVGAFLTLQRREGQDWRDLATVGAFRPVGP